MSRSLAQAKLRRRVAGQAIMLEAVLAAGISLVLAGSFGLAVTQAVQREQATTVGDQMHLIADAAAAYIKSNYQGILAAQGVGQVRAYDLNAALPSQSGTPQTLAQAGFLPGGINPTNRYGQTYKLLIQQDVAGHLRAMLATTGGQQVNDSRDGTIAQRVGAAGGYWPVTLPAGASQIHGTYAGWSYSSAYWNNVVQPGHPVVTLDYALGNSSGDWLNRHDNGAGVTEPNTMHANIMMGKNDRTGGQTSIAGADYVGTQLITNDCAVVNSGCASSPNGVITAVKPGIAASPLDTSVASLATLHVVGAAQIDNGVAVSGTDGLIWGNGNGKLAITQDAASQKWLSYVPTGPNSPIGFIVDRPGGVQSPIYYDLNNAQYYVVPSGASHMNNINMDGNLVANGNISANIINDQATISQNFTASAVYYGFNPNTNWADVTHYLVPSGTSKLSTLQVDTSLTPPTTASYNSSCNNPGDIATGYGAPGLPDSNYSGKLYSCEGIPGSSVWTPSQMQSPVQIYQLASPSINGLSFPPINCPPNQNSYNATCPMGIHYFCSLIDTFENPDVYSNTALDYYLKLYNSSGYPIPGNNGYNIFYKPNSVSIDFGYGDGIRYNWILRRGGASEYGGKAACFG